MEENGLASFEGGPEFASRMGADWNCQLQKSAFSLVNVFQISLPLSDVIPNASFLSDLTKSRNICGDYIWASGRHLVLCTYAQKIVDFEGCICLGGDDVGLGGNSKGKCVGLYAGNHVWCNLGYILARPGDISSRTLAFHALNYGNLATSG